MAVAGWLNVPYPSVASAGEPVDAAVTTDNGDPPRATVSVERERELLEYERTVPTRDSPGLFYGKSATAPTFRIYADADFAAIEKAIAGTHPEVELAVSRYTRSDLASLESLVSEIPLRREQAFGSYYDAAMDSYVVGGNADADAIAHALHPAHYEFRPSANAGRVTKTHDPAPHRGEHERFNLRQTEHPDTQLHNRQRADRSNARPLR